MVCEPRWKQHANRCEAKKSGRFRRHAEVHQFKHNLQRTDRIIFWRRHSKGRDWGVTNFKRTKISLRLYLAQGLWDSQTVEIKDNFKIMTEEPFGPLTPLLTFKNFDEVIKKANNQRATNQSKRASNLYSETLFLFYSTGLFINSFRCEKFDFLRSK